jgi:hypothetical protein
LKAISRCLLLPSNEGFVKERTKPQQATIGFTEQVTGAISINPTNKKNNQ